MNGNGGAGNFPWIFVALLIFTTLLSAGVLAFVLIKIRKRQQTLHKMLSVINKRLERMENNMCSYKENGSYFLDEEEDIQDDDTWKDQMRKNEKSGGAASESEEPDQNMVLSPEEKAAAETKKEEQKNTTVLVKETESYPLSGVKVKEATHYNPEAPAALEEIPREEAVFLLYSDGTVRPNERQFGMFNNSSYYANHD